MDSAWLDRHTAKAPSALRTRALHYLAAQGGDLSPVQIAAAADQALSQVLAQAGDRPAALDLLAADALITLALLGQAQAAPEALEQFAISVLRSWRSDP